MENVVYILGAGFSSPLGIPTMSEFLDVARELHRTREIEFKEFKKIFSNMQRMQTAIARYVNLDAAVYYGHGWFHLFIRRFSGQRSNCIN